MSRSSLKDSYSLFNQLIDLSETMISYYKEAVDFNPDDPEINELANDVSSINKVLNDTDDKLRAINKLGKEYNSYSFQSMKEIKEVYHNYISEASKSDSNRINLLRKVSYDPNPNNEDIAFVNNASNVDIPLVCPISQTPITEPCRSRICGHIYNKSAAIQLMKLEKKNKRITCPLVGCGKSVGQGDLEDLMSKPQEI